ncbi:helix-turn-helix transcriptional regulator [Microterricola viridarii]|uniref:Predicted transcriptional regulator, ArsR family n=1 Tax=Microterricola viridarii TaxID=412690 RepID=A0A1H1YJY1_9MICO|nr:helix-turn-helix domain-containing protein [Microterricola viridarii]SDT21635.1 Predicted transcriptional regulator, ArsR family [Microterricola viridarii]
MPPPPPPLPERISAVAVLDDPARRALYELVAQSAQPIGRDAAAAAIGLSRSTAAFHLDRLAEAGLLAVEFRRLSGKTGPGSGRPAKLYSRAAGELSVSLPARHYDLAGELMAAAIGESSASGEPVLEALARVAAQAGRAIGAGSDDLGSALEANGFEPREQGDGGIVLGNCPFHRLAQAHTAVVCSLNYQLLCGVAEGVGDTAHTIIADPDAGECCVRAVPGADSPQ